MQINDIIPIVVFFLMVSSFFVTAVLWLRVLGRFFGLSRWPEFFGVFLSAFLYAGIQFFLGFALFWSIYTEGAAWTKQQIVGAFVYMGLIIVCSLFFSGGYYWVLKKVKGPSAI